MFSIRGIASGRYVLVAWPEEPSCELYDPDALATCRAAGKTADVPESGRLVLDMQPR